MQNNPTVTSTNTQPNTTAKRVIEIEFTALMGGFTLPMPAEDICELEDDGWIVDLESGLVLSPFGGEVQA